MTEETTELLGYTLTLFTEAVHDLCGTRTTRITTDHGDTRTHTRPGRYQEIRDNIGGQQGTQTGSIARSMPPLWIDAADWLQSVDADTHAWNPGHPHSTTPDLLYALTDASWRPQDTGLLLRYTGDIGRWITHADQLLEPDTIHRWELTAPCPACGATTIYRRDNGGDTIRQAALALTRDGCICQACRTTWAPRLYQHLALVLGCEPPAGILE